MASFSGMLSRPRGFLIFIPTIALFLNAMAIPRPALRECSALLYDPLEHALSFLDSQSTPLPETYARRLKTNAEINPSVKRYVSVVADTLHRILLGQLQAMSSSVDPRVLQGATVGDANSMNLYVQYLIKTKDDLEYKQRLLAKKVLLVLKILAYAKPTDRLERTTLFSASLSFSSPADSFSSALHYTDNDASYIVQLLELSLNRIRKMDYGIDNLTLDAKVVEAMKSVNRKFEPGPIMVSKVGNQSRIIIRPDAVDNEDGLSGIYAIPEHSKWIF